MGRGSPKSWSKVPGAFAVLIGVVALAGLLGSRSDADAGAAPASSRGYVPAADCHAVKFIGVRGSGDGSSTLGVIATSISAELAKKAKAAGVDYVAYGLPYAAVGIDWRRFLHPASAAVLLAQYRLSEREGRNNLRTLIREQVRDCPREQLVVEGYSQGAHAVGDVFSEEVGGLTKDERSHVKAVILLADPRFNSREPFDAGNYRSGRNGILGARSPGDLSSVANRIRAWCHRDDIVCQGPGSPANHDQGRYFTDYASAMVDFIVGKLAFSAGSAVPVVTGVTGNSGTVGGPSFPVTVEYRDQGCSVVGGTWTDQFGTAHAFSAGRGSCSNGVGSLIAGYGACTSPTGQPGKPGEYPQSVIIQNARGRVSSPYSFPIICRA